MTGCRLILLNLYLINHCDGLDNDDSLLCLLDNGNISSLL